MNNCFKLLVTASYICVFGTGCTTGQSANRSDGEKQVFLQPIRGDARLLQQGQRGKGLQQGQQVPGIRQGEKVLVRLTFFSNEPQVTVEKVVNRNGDIPLPVVGLVHIEGLTPLQAQDLIARKFTDRGFVRDKPMVYVGIIK